MGIGAFRTLVYMGQDTKLMFFILIDYLAGGCVFRVKMFGDKIIIVARLRDKIPNLSRPAGPGSASMAALQSADSCSSVYTIKIPLGCILTLILRSKFS